MSRTLLSTLIGKGLHFKVPTKEEQEEIGIQHSNTLLLCDVFGKPVAQVEVDDLFDHEGNRFENDVEFP